MTVGQRIAQKRKELGLSQEGLGEKLSVSRQAIYKWESDATLPEIEKLIALSKIFGVSIGWLLGVEENTAESNAAESNAPVSGELTQTQLDMVEEIVRRYQAAQPAPPKRRRWPWVLVALALIVVFVKLFSTLNELQNNFNRIENSVSYIDRNVDSQINSITNRVEHLLDRLNNFTVEHSAKFLKANLVDNTVTFEVSAVPKTYTEGMRAVFQAEYGNGVVEAEAVQGENHNYTAALTCPLTDEIVVSVVFVTGEKRETQKIQTFYNLYSESFPAQYISAMPLFLHVEGDVLQSGAYHVEFGKYSSSNIVVAKAWGMKLGLFQDNKLVYWFELLEEKPENFVGEWEGLFYRNPKDYTLNRESTYCLALVVTDEYNRTMVLAESAIAYIGEDWTYSNKAISGDPADWEY